MDNKVRIGRPDRAHMAILCAIGRPLTAEEEVDKKRDERRYDPSTRQSYRTKYEEVKDGRGRVSFTRTFIGVSAMSGQRFETADRAVYIVDNAGTIHRLSRDKRSKSEKKKAKRVMRAQRKLEQHRRARLDKAVEEISR